MIYNYRVEVWIGPQHIDDIYFETYRQAEDYVNRNLDMPDVQAYIIKVN